MIDLNFKKQFLLKGERLDDMQYNNLHIIQHPKKYCFTTDAVLLANYIAPQKNGKMVDLCSGSGVIGMLAQSKAKLKDVVLVELQPRLADMSKRTVVANNLQNIVVINQKLQGISKEIGFGAYDIVACNPPYKAQSKHVSEDEEIAICKHEIAVTLQEVVSEASKLLKLGGYFYTINKEDRLADLIVLMRENNLEAKEVVVVPSAKGGSLVMVKAKKGAKSGLRVFVKNI